MDDVSKHQSPKSRSMADVWFVLTVTGGASAVLQMWHATHSGGTVLLIAALVGLVPAAAAIGLSHVVAGHKSAMALRVITVLVMLAVMAASASAVAAVVRPIDGPAFSWVYAIALDSAAMSCVWVLLGAQDRKAAEATALETAQAAAESAASATREAQLQASALAAELAESRASADAGSAVRERLEADLRSAQETARARRSRGKARNAPGSAPADDVTLEARALELLASDLEMPGAELARKLGVSPGYGRKLKARLTQGDRPQERLSGTPGSAPQERDGVGG
jgi:hypothetical protein